MPTVNTILGPVDVNSLGFTLTHEHVRESSAGVPYTYPELFDHEDDVAEGAGAVDGVRLLDGSLLAGRRGLLWGAGLERGCSGSRRPCAR